MKVFINSIGVSVPPHKIPQLEHSRILQAASDLSVTDRLRLRKIYNGSGIDSRYSVLEEFGRMDEGSNILFHPMNHHPELTISARMELYEKYAKKLILDASADALQSSGYDRSAVSHVITFTCTGLYAPGHDMLIAEELRLNRNVERTCINFMGCYASVNALRSAYHIVRSDPKAVVMIAGVELCTLHYQRSAEGDQLVANALFGDGASASVISARKTSSINFLLKNFYGEFHPEGKSQMVWSIGDHGFNLALSAAIPEMILQNIKSFYNELLLRSGCKHGDIAHYAIHPGGLKILSAVEQALGLSKKQNAVAYNILRQYGNMSSVTLLFILKEYMELLSRNADPQRLLACAFGPGLTMESFIAEVV